MLIEVSRKEMKKVPAAVKKVKLTEVDATEYLDSPEAIAAFLNDALVTNDQAQITQALGLVAKAVGMTKIAEQAGLGRESLYKALAPSGNPTFATVLRVMSALKVRLFAEAA